MSQEPGPSYPGQPATGTMAPPPPPPPGTFAAAQTPAPEPAPKKRRTALIIVIVLAIVLCGIGACAVAGVALWAGNDDTETISQAEAHFSAMMSAVDTASVSLQGLKFDETNIGEAQAVVDQTSQSLRTGRDEIAASRVAIEGLEASQGKTDYLASLDAATQSLDGLDALVIYLGSGMGMLEKMADGAKAAKSGNDLLNSAISSGNSKKYDKMKSKARDSAAKYVKAAALFDEAHKVDTSAGLDQAAKYARKRREVALVVVKMGTDGKAGRVSAYNKGIANMNKLNAAAEKIGEPAIVEDDNWVEKRLADLDKKITTNAENADALRAKALTALGYE